MQAIKQSALLRPISRSSSPVPAAKVPIGNGDAADAPLDIPITRTTSKGPLNRLSLTSLRGRSPAPTPQGQTAVPATTLVQDGSYLEALGLKIGEAISRALTPPPPTSSYGPALDDSFNNRRAIPAGRGTALGGVIIAELTAAKEKPQLYKAIVRLLHRPLSVLLNNVSAQLLPVLSSPSFQVCDPAHGHNGVQLHALAIAGFASELIKCFDQASLGANNFSESRGDGLQGIREGFEGVVTRVLTPLTALIKQDVLQVTADLEKLPAEATLQNTKVTFLKANPPNQSYHPAVHVLQARIPTHGKALQRYSTIAGKAYDSQLAGLAISFIWHALVALAHRKPAPATVSPPVTPGSANTPKKRISPPGTPRIGLNFRGSMTASRPPSPTSLLPISRAADTRAMYDLLHSLPRPAQENTDACEAIDEGFEDLRALAGLFDSLDAPGCAIGDADMQLLTDELPALIGLPILLSAHRGADDGGITEDVWTLLDLEEQEYRRTCLASFGREEACSETVLRKLLEVISSRGANDCALARWIKTRLE